MRIITLVLLCNLSLSRGHLERFRSSFGDMRALEAYDDEAGTPEGIKSAKKYPYADGTDKYPYFGASHPVETLYKPKEAPEDDRPPAPPTPIYQTNLYTAAFYGPNTFFAGPPPPHVDTVELVPPPVQWQYPAVGAPYIVPQETSAAHSDPPTVVDGQLGPMAHNNGPLFGGNLLQTPGAFSGSYLPNGGLLNGGFLQNGGFVNGNFLQTGNPINGNLLQSGGFMGGNMLPNGNLADGNLMQNGGFVNGGPLLNGGFVDGNFMQNNAHIIQGGNVLTAAQMSPAGGIANFKSEAPQKTTANHVGSVLQDVGKNDGKVNQSASVVQNAKVENGGSVFQSAQVVQTSDNVVHDADRKESDHVPQGAKVEEVGGIAKDADSNHESLDRQHGSRNQGSATNAGPEYDKAWDHNAGFPDTVPGQQNVNIDFRGQPSPQVKRLERGRNAKRDVKQTPRRKEG